MYVEIISIAQQANPKLKVQRDDFRAMANKLIGSGGDDARYLSVGGLVQQTWPRTVARAEDDFSWLRGDRKRRQSVVSGRGSHFCQSNTPLRQPYITAKKSMARNKIIA